MKSALSNYLAWSLAALSLILFLFLAYFMWELQRIRADTRLTRDLVWRIDAERDHALKGDVAQAVQYLQMFQEPPEHSTDFEKHLAAIITVQRKAATRDVIAYLRSRTGDDLGDDPLNWIEKYSKTSSESP